MNKINIYVPNFELLMGGSVNYQCALFAHMFCTDVITPYVSEGGVVSYVISADMVNSWYVDSMIKIATDSTMRAYQISLKCIDPLNDKYKMVFE